MSTSNSTRNDLARIAMKAELLDAETEYKLAVAWRDDRDEAALHRMITAYMRLAVAMASKFRRYGAPLTDLIQEASVGLMKAADKFDPDRGVRFSTYAAWWIKASIQDYVMRDWSMVRTGSTSSQKALFFNLRRVRSELERKHGPVETGEDAANLRDRISEAMNVPLRDVEMMEARMSASDYSLNAVRSEDEGREWIEALEDSSPVGAETVTRDSELSTVRKWVSEACEDLTDRERTIIARRRLTSTPTTLSALGVELGLSKERVRQLETQAMKKMKNQLVSRYGEQTRELAAAL